MQFLGLSLSWTLQKHFPLSPVQKRAVSLRSARQFCSPKNHGRVKSGENNEKYEKITENTENLQMMRCSRHAGRVLFQSRAARRRYERIFTKMQKIENFGEKKEKMLASLAFFLFFHQNFQFFAFL